MSCNFLEVSIFSRFTLSADHRTGNDRAKHTLSQVRQYASNGSMYLNDGEPDSVLSAPRLFPVAIPRTSQPPYEYCSQHKVTAFSYLYSRTSSASCVFVGSSQIHTPGIYLGVHYVIEVIHSGCNTSTGNEQCKADVLCTKAESTQAIKPMQDRRTRYQSGNHPSDQT